MSQVGQFGDSSYVIDFHHRLQHICSHSCATLVDVETNCFQNQKLNGILVQVTIYHRLQIGRDLDQSETYDIS